MKTYALLLRGINVGGKNKIPMADLRICLVQLGCSDVITYIQSGNVVVRSDMDAQQLGPAVETMISNNFKLDSSLIKVLVLDRAQFQHIVDNKPAGFGEQPDVYHSDVVFLINIDAGQAMSVFDPREGVDHVWPGNGVIYSQRVSELRTKSRLGKIIGTSAYRSMTIRNWNTTVKILELMRSHDSIA
ncbi:MAG TPA: DUF1697 domain-containing protein [Candidatus Saccharimonadales bacterium]|jgi:uncharacterized protein (DUF1697 family)